MKTAVAFLFAVSSSVLGVACFSFNRMPIRPVKSLTRYTQNDDTMERRTFVQSFTSGASMAALTGSVLLAPSKAIAGGNLPQTGAKAPSFELPNSRGSTTSLEDLTKGGKWTVIYFYPGAFTSGCTLEARGFQRDVDQYQSLNTQIVGVSVDAVEKNASFCVEEKLDFFMLTDENGIISKKYGSALSIPGFGTFSNRQTYIIDPKGDLKWVFTDVESHVSRHSAEVLGKLKELTTQT